MRTVRRACRRLGAVLWLLVAVPGLAQELPDMTPDPEPRPAGPPPNAHVQQPRAFGYFVGDVLTQRVLLQLDGREFRPGALPRPERVNNWLERRALAIETSEDGRRWLMAGFQVINAPPRTTRTAIPAWEVPAAGGTTPLRIGEWPLTLSPLSSRDTSDGPLEADALRPDREPPRVATGSLLRQVTVWGSACAATLVLWLAWWLWREWRAASTQPFARALHEIRRIDDSASEAWHALHRAFDRTAGYTMQAATLPDLFSRAPHLLPLREDIERFFRQSSERFFGSGTLADPLPLRQLCAELRRAEKRQER